MLRNIANKLKAVKALVPQTITADTTSSAVDLKDFKNFAFVVTTGAFSFTGVNKVNCLIRESDDDSTYTDSVYSKELAASGDASNVHMIEYKGSKRYVKLLLDVSGTVSVTMAVNGVAEPLVLPPL